MLLTQRPPRIASRLGTGQRRGPKPRLRGRGRRAGEEAGEESCAGDQSRTTGLAVPHPMKVEEDAVDAEFEVR